jgi:hypothetical protein
LDQHIAQDGGCWALLGILCPSLHGDGPHIRRHDRFIIHSKDIWPEILVHNEVSKILRENVTQWYFS